MKGETGYKKKTGLNKSIRTTQVNLMTEGKKINESDQR